MTAPTTAIDLAASVRSGETTCAAVVDEAIAEIEARDGEIHAFNHVAADEARSRAAESDAMRAQVRAQRLRATRRAPV